MVNYWSFDGSTNDIIGNKNIKNVKNGNLTHDRFGRPNSALRFYYGKGEIPSRS